MAKKKTTKKAAVNAEKITFYGLRSWYFSNGSVYKRAFEEERKSEPLNYYVRKETCDIYFEYFPTKESRDRALNAGKTSADEITAREMGTHPIEGTENIAQYYKVLQLNAN